MQQTPETNWLAWLITAILSIATASAGGVAWFFNYKAARRQAAQNDVAFLLTAYKTENAELKLENKMLKGELNGQEKRIEDASFILFDALDILPQIKRAKSESAREKVSESIEAKINEARKVLRGENG